MKVLGIYGSPRRKGNTAVLLDQFLKGAQAAGAQTESIHAIDLKISPCIECNDCLKTGECSIKDEMTEVYPKLLSADLVVLAVPIFFYNIPAQAKVLVDRVQALWSRKYILKKKPPNGHRRGFFISAAGTKGERVFDGAILTVKYFFDAIGVKYDGELVFRRIGTKGEIEKHPDALPQAFETGQALVKKMQS